MILRRVIAHFRKQEWAAIAIDFVIVVIGVFVGIQVSNWNAARLADQASEAYLLRIQEDIRDNRRDIERAMEYYRQTRRHGEAALAALAGAPEGTGGRFIIDLYQTTQIAPRLTRRDAYDELLAAGLLNSFGSVELRQRLANYYVNDQTFAVVVLNVPPLRERVRSLMPLAAQRAVRAGCGEVIAADAMGASVAGLPERCEIDLSAEETAQTVAAAFEAPGLAADLTRHVSDLDQKVEILGLMIERNTDLDRFIDKARQ